MKKGLSVILVAAMLVALLAVTPISVGASQKEIVDTGATSGTTGDCTWTLNGKELTISGKGATKSYNIVEEVAPGEETLKRSLSLTE